MLFLPCFTIVSLSYELFQIVPFLFKNEYFRNIHHIFIRNFIDNFSSCVSCCITSLMYSFPAIFIAFSNFIISPLSMLFVYNYLYIGNKVIHQKVKCFFNIFLIYIYDLIKNHYFTNHKFLFPNNIF